MKLQKIILAAAAAAVLALSASCRATGEDGGGGGDGGPVALNIVFDPNGGYWLNSDDHDDKSDTAERSTTQIVGRLITPPALSETESETPLPLYLDWEGQQRRSNLYQFVGWYQLPEGETTPPARIQLGEEVPQDLIARVVSTDTIVDVDALLPGYNMVPGDTETSEITLYALWLEPPECYRVSFYKFFNGTDPQELIGTPVELQEDNSGVSQSQIPSSVSRTHYNKNSDNWYKVLDDGTVSDTAFDFSAEVTDSHKLVMKWTGITYQISFKPEGGTPAPSVVQIQYPTPVAASNIPTVTRNYYTLGGWYKTGAQITDANKLTVGSLITANTEYTANWTPADTYYLESLSLIITSETANKITGFAPNVDSYAVFVSSSRPTFKVKAKAINSTQAKITITDDGVANITDAVSSTGVESGVINSPVIGSQKVINVIVKTTANVTQTYKITVNIDSGTLHTWAGTAYNKLSGGTASDGKVITQVVAWNADRSLKGVATFADSTLADTRVWTIEMPQSPPFRPVYFTVYFTDGTNNFVSDEIIPAGAPLDPATGITLNATKTGIRLADANEFAQLGDPANRDKDFALGGDIDLTNTGTDWDGPSLYTGHFYGNGYTIKGLQLTKTAGETGLFNSLGNGAVIENFTLQVSTPDTINLTGVSLVGGIIGHITGSSSAPMAVTVKNVKTEGDFTFDSVPGDCKLQAGGLIGSIDDYVTLTFENCATSVNITLLSVPDGNSGISLGGLIGSIKANNTITVRKSFVTGTLSSDSGNDRDLYTGMIALIWGRGTTLNIEDCYMTGNAFSIGSSTTVNRVVYAGGLLGCIYERNVTVNISNSAVLSEKIIARAAGTNNGSGRILGGITPNGRITGTQTFVNNFARKNIITGSDPDASPVDVAGDAASAEGLGKAIDEFKQSSTWTNAAPAGLGWSAADWDFDGLTKSGSAFYWPRLK
ncbi:MAG: hypothetical protein Pg6A_10260 [Termitinemataceae bacterium]|nr:MAG: hypothetical protein Pg6A_10260 [Termitinemataceae bacterium]